MILEIDRRITSMFYELHSLYKEGLTIDEKNELWNIVMSDGKSHWF